MRGSVKLGNKVTYVPLVPLGLTQHPVSPHRLCPVCSWWVDSVYFHRNLQHFFALTLSCLVSCSGCFWSFTFDLSGDSRDFLTHTASPFPPLLLDCCLGDLFPGSGVQILLPPAWAVGVSNSGPSPAASAPEGCPCRSRVWKLAACSSSSGRSCSLTWGVFSWSASPVCPALSWKLHSCQLIWSSPQPDPHVYL